MGTREEVDSGMGSMQESKDCSPDKAKSSDDDIEDETLCERLWGLTEMFPEGLRNITYKVYMGTSKGVKMLYSASRTTCWIFFSSSAILFAPVLFEIERAQLEEAQRSQQKQVLLGPNTAMGGGAPPLR